MISSGVKWHGCQKSLKSDASDDGKGYKSSNIVRETQQIKFLEGGVGDWL